MFCAQNRCLIGWEDVETFQFDQSLIITARLWYNLIKQLLLVFLACVDRKDFLGVGLA